MWFLSAGNLIAETLRGRARPGQSSLLAAVALVVTLILDLLLIPPYGAVGGAIASTAAYATYGILSLRAVARLDGVPIHSLLVATRPGARRVHPQPARSAGPAAAARLTSTISVYHSTMALNIKDAETERLVNEVARRTGESKTRAVRVGDGGAACADWTSAPRSTTAGGACGATSSTRSGRTCRPTSVVVR